MEHYKLTNKLFESEIKDIVVTSIFPNMNSTHQKVLIDYTIKLINIISLCSNFDIEKKQDDYLNQFRQNNYQDVKWLISHLLPFINEENNPKNITSFDDIYHKKKINDDINKTEPSYLYSNLQYNRCIRNKNNYVERNFSMEDINDNYYLLVDTIRNCSNKLCVNWINVMPYTTKTYQKTNLYRNTITNFMEKKIFDWDPKNETNLNLSNNELCYKLNQKMNGLYVGHIYEEIVDLYYSIKDYKWIIYDVFIDENLAPMTDFILATLKEESELLLQYPEWDKLDENQQDHFEIRIKILLEQVVRLTISNIKISMRTIKSFMRSFIFAFEKSFHKNEAKKEGYITLDDQINEEIDDDTSDDEDNEKPTSEAHIMVSFKSLKMKFIFNYMAESMCKLKQTWYGYLLLSDDKKKIIEFYKLEDHQELCKIKSKPGDFRVTISDKEIQLEREKKKLNLNPHIDEFNENINKGGDYFTCEIYPKNIYNYAKSFSHDANYDKQDKKKNKFVPLPKHWCSLTNKQKIKALKKINGSEGLNPLEWFRISRYIKKYHFYEIFEKEEYPYITNLSDKSEDQFNLKINMTNLLIYKVIKRIIIDIIFQSLIHKGILTQFIPDKERSDKTILDGNVENVIKNKNALKKQQEIFGQNDQNEYWTGSYHYLTSKRYKDMDGDDYKIIEDKKEFNYFSYGLKRAWYVAGAYDWIGQIGFCHRFINNRVIFITGATGVGKSTEIPKLFMYYARVIDGILSPKVVCTQPRKNAVKGNTQRVSTTLGVPILQDGKKTENYYIQYKYQGEKHQARVHHPSLLFITGDSLMLELDDPLLKRKKGDKYSSVNQYDVIMIDEAHEHKTHMDILLTFLKLPISSNNSLRLVIVSATMDDDEPRYRRFFRDINDNRKFPLNTWIDSKKIDRINIDRRYHIAPPGAGTRFNIKEHYRPIVNEQEIYVKINDIIQEILKKSPSGHDILIFQPGSKEINDTVNLLNLKTPPNVLALPYYSDLPEEKRNFVGEIDKIQNRNKIKMDKDKNFGLVDDFTIGTNNYDRFIIVATNIAEASITIQTLRYIIETGTEKANMYDYTKRNEKLFKDNISESSRRQRKGRVGRTAPGEVYYLYEKGKMENNKISYEFARRNIYDILYRYLRKDNENNDIFFLSEYDLDNIKQIKNSKDFEKLIKNKTGDEKSSSIKKIIEQQYFVDNRYFIYYGNDDAYDYNNYISPAKYFRTGLDVSALTDNDGNFYIIHPEELKLRRNINGDIVGIKNIEYEEELKFIKTKDSKYKGSISSKKMDSFWKILLDFMYVGIIETDRNKTNDLVKTAMGDFFMKNSEIFEMYNHNLFRSIIFGIANKYDEIFKICSMCETISFDLTKLFIKTPDNKSTLPLFYKKFGSNNSSDGEALLKILDIIHLILDKNKISEKSLFFQDYISEIDLVENKMNLSANQYAELLGPREKYSDQLKEKITLQNLDDNINKIKKITQKNIINKIKNITEIENWCFENGLEYKIIIKYLEKYFDLYISFLQFKNKGDETFDYVINLIRNFNRLSKYDKLTTSLIFGFPQNITVNVGELKYLSLYSINDQNVFNVAMFTPQKLKTFIDRRKMGEYILYLGNNIEKNEITMLFHLRTKEILLLPHIYNYILNINFDKKKYIENNDKKYKDAIQIDKSRKQKFLLTYIGTNINNVILNYKHILYNVKRDFENYKIDINHNLNFIRIIEPGMIKYVQIISDKLIKN